MNDLELPVVVLNSLAYYTGSLLYCGGPWPTGNLSVAVINGFDYLFLMNFDDTAQSTLTVSDLSSGNLLGNCDVNLDSSTAVCEIL